jgi:hypothetical protein
MEITGKIVYMLPLVTGQGKNGEWRKQEFVIEVAEGQYPKKVCLSLWGEKIDQASLVIGETAKVSFDLESREYNGRWFTEARAWRVEKQGAAVPAASATQATPHITTEPTATFNASPVEDDLPF